MATRYGNFDKFCSFSTLPACHLFQAYDESLAYCPLRGFSTVHNGRIQNLGLVLISFFAAVSCLIFIISAQRRPGAVGRHEMQLLFFSYMIASIAAIFANGGFIFNYRILAYFSAIEIGATCSTAWLLIVNGAVAYQLLPDGGFLSLSLSLLSGLAFFIGTGYIALDSAFDWTGTFDSAPGNPTLLRNYAVYTVYLLFPIIAIVVYMICELNLAIRLLREWRPALLLMFSFLLFVIAQIFEFVVSRYICSDTHGKIDGSMFACLFTLFSFYGLWAFWHSITEDEWMGTSEEEFGDNRSQS
ncbi:chitin synthase III catalytic subunit [Lipomyces oligophaga]|uniref:chitin synthase III catalytic subunit n=1 Tax=Lipomyces oligophaga TaxID=45792 RepID=UPI0034CD4ED3